MKKFKTGDSNTLINNRVDCEYKRSWESNQYPTKNDVDLDGWLHNEHWLEGYDPIMFSNDCNNINEWKQANREYREYCKQAA